MFQKWFALSKKGAHDLKVGIIASTVANISLIMPINLMILTLYDLIAPLLGIEKRSPNVWGYLAAGAVLLLIIFFAHLWQYRYTYVSAYSESANRRVTLAEKLRTLPLSFFGKKDLSELTNTIMSDCTHLEEVFSHAIPQMFGAVLFIMLMAVGMFIYDWRMALALLIVFPVAIAIVVGSKWVQDKFSARQMDSVLDVADGVQESLDNMRELQAYNMADEYLDGLEKKLNRVVRASMHTELVTGSFTASAISVLRLGFASTVLVGASLIAAGQLDLFKYIVFLLAASRIYDPLQTVLMQTAEIFNAHVRIKRMQKLENTPVQHGEKRWKPDGYDIRFQHVSFAYENTPVLRDLSFTAKQGEVTALVGPSGSGKSTAARLAARFWDVNGGAITIGGVNVTTVEPETLLQDISIVFQDVVLFNESILENIRLGRRGATDEEVYAAARAAQCDAFIRRLPDGYHTVIGENGSTLSGGERQRISIARALLKNAPVILLDEVTASLDVENETAVQRAISTLIRDKTVLIIAHRMRTIAKADRIVVLENGIAAEQGKPDELLVRENSLFYHMVEAQGGVRVAELPQ